MTCQFEGILGNIKCSSGEWTIVVKASLIDSETVSRIATDCHNTTILVTIDPVEEKTFGGEAQ